MPQLLAIIDLETTGLVAGYHEPWEAALILYDLDARKVVERHQWFLPVLHLERADPTALRIGGFWDRFPRQLRNRTGSERREPGDPDMEWVPHGTALSRFAWELAAITQGALLVGANPAFDDRFLTALFTEAGVAPCWHYRPVCVETLAFGYLHGLHAAASAAPIRLEDGPRRNDPVGLPVPWKARDLTVLLLGEERTAELDASKHTAEGDCDWALALWQAVAE